MNIGLMQLMLEIAGTTFRSHGKQSVKIDGAGVNFVQICAGTAPELRAIGGA
jgi:hypothetical protein